MREAVIVSTARTGLAKSHRGGFNNTGGVAMAGHAVKHSIERAGIDPAEVEEDDFLGRPGKFANAFETAIADNHELVVQRLVGDAVD